MGVLGIIGISGILGCSKRSNIARDNNGGSLQNEVVEAPMPVIGSKPVNMMPKASVFKMSGDYADHVAVTLGTDGELTYFPAPSDISVNSEPLSIGDGWWLNRQGLSANSVFTRWTFAEYRALPNVPSPAEIKAAVIPGARVTEFRVLDITLSQAAQNPKALIEYVNK